MISESQAVYLRKEEFLKIHLPELLSAEGKRYYAYLDFPEKQVDLINFWQRNVQKIFFFFARSAVVTYQFIFDVLSIDGFQPFILPVVIFEMVQKGELGIAFSSSFAHILLEKNSFSQAKKHLKQLADEGELNSSTQIICYEYLENKLRVAETHLAELFRARSFLTESEMSHEIREASGVGQSEVEILCALLLVATPIRIYEDHYFNSAIFAGEDEISRKFMLFELEKAISEGEALLAQPPKVFSKGNISAILAQDVESKSELFPANDEREKAKKQLAYNRILHEFILGRKDWEEISEFNKNMDYVKLKAASTPFAPANISDQKLIV